MNSCSSLSGEIVGDQVDDSNEVKDGSKEESKNEE